MNKLGRIYGKNSIYNSLQKSQVPRSNLTKDVMTPEERNQGRLQKVERSAVLMDW
jgi:hypothetical protein